MKSQTLLFIHNLLTDKLHAKEPREQKIEGIYKKVRDIYHAKNATVLTSQVIEEHFINLNQKFRYFPKVDRTILEKYEECFKVCHYMARNDIGNNASHVIAKQAYNMFVLFSSKNPQQNIFKDVDRFINHHCAKLINPIRNIFQYELPIFRDEKNKPTFNLEAWKKIISKGGMQVMNKITLASQMDKILGHAPKDIDEFKRNLYKVLYKNYNKNPELAKLCYHYNAVESMFDSAIDLLENGELKPTEQTNLPQIALDIGKEVDQKKAGYYLVPMPHNNPRGLIAGQITNCCMSISGFSERCVIDGMNRPNNGFYLLLKTKKGSTGFDVNNIDWNEFEQNGHEIVGAAYAWLSEQGNFTFDSWENLRPDADNPMMKEVLTKYAQLICDQQPEISRVTIGMGPKTPEDISNMPRLQTPDVLKEGWMYVDAINQVELYTTEKLDKLRVELANIIPKEQINKIISYNHANLLLGLPTDLLAEIGQNHLELLHPLFLRGCKNSAELQIVYEKLLTLKQQDKNKYDTLLLNSADIFNVSYFYNRLPIMDIFSMDMDKILPLISEDALFAYSVEARADDLFNLDIDKTKLLLSTSAAYAYMTRQIRIENLIDLDIDRIKLLISDNATKIYDKKQATGNDLKDLDLEKIRLLTSDDAIITYTHGKATARDLRDLDLEKIRLLTSDNARKIYGREQGLVKDLKDLDLEKIRLLISDSAIMTYDRGKATIADLKDLDVEKRELLTSDNAIIAYGEGKTTVADLKNFDLTKIKLLISDEALRLYECMFDDINELKVDYLKGFDNSIISLHISHDALEAYFSDHLTPAEYFAKAKINVDTKIADKLAGSPNWQSHITSASTKTTPQK